MKLAAGDDDDGMDFAERRKSLRRSRSLRQKTTRWSFCVAKCKPGEFRATVHFYLIDSFGTIGKTLDFFILFLIVWACIMFVISIEYKEILVIEVFLTVCFTIEYVFRIYGSHSRLGYAVSFYGFIDLASILPFYLEAFGIS
eukprot:UN29888